MNAPTGRFKSSRAVSGVRWLGRLRPDGFTLSLMATVALAGVLPPRGAAAVGFGWLTTAAVVLLFFLHGAKLSREAIAQGLGNWRLHGVVLASTFVAFPLLGLLVRALPASVAAPTVTAGVLYLCLLPSAVQSSIGFTSVAGGDVPAAVCSASISNVLGVAVTPLLAGLFMHVRGAERGVSLQAGEEVAAQLLLPFVLGHLSRPLTGRFVDRRKGLLTFVDRGSILLIVFTAFAAAVVAGLWRRLGVRDLLTVFGLDAAVLATALTLTTLSARWLGFGRPQEIAIVFCGSKKSLATGAPMARVLFPAAQVGALIVPVMIFHQLQLMTCAVLARRYADERDRGAVSPVVRARP